MKPSKKIVAFIILAGFLLAGAFYLSRNKESPDNERLAETKKTQEVLKIGFFTDVQCYGSSEETDGGSEKWILNWRCSQPLEQFVAKMNNDFKPDFVVENGDFIDGRDHRSFEDFIDAEKITDSLQMPFFHVLGNHETRSFEKDVWLELVDYEKPFYYFDAKGYRIIVLDGNNKPINISTGESVATGPELQFYPGFLGRQQQGWLEKTLEDSKSLGLDVLVFVHQPPVKTDAKEQAQLFVGGEKLRELFGRYNVRAVFSGHIERLCHFNYDGKTDYYVLQGFYKANSGLKKEFRYKDSGAFYELTINNETVEVKMYHRDGKNSEYGSFIVNPGELPSCLDGGTLADK